jgi:hypothetical protein
MVPLNTAHGLVEAIMATAPVVTCTSSLGTPLAMDLSMANDLAPLILGSALRAMRLPLSLVGPDRCRRYRAPLCHVSAPHLLCLWTTSRGAHALGTSFNSTIGLSTCSKSPCLKRRAKKGWDLRLEVRRIRSGASRDRHGDVV